MKEQVVHLDDEGLLTFCDVENILNNRPLTLLSDYPDDVKPITPYDLLLAKPAASLPIGIFFKDDIVLAIDQPTGSWVLARIKDVSKERKRLVRVVTIKTPSGIYQRPIHKLTLILNTQ